MNNYSTLTIFYYLHNVCFFGCLNGKGDDEEEEEEVMSLQFSDSEDDRDDEEEEEMLEEEEEDSDVTADRLPGQCACWYVSNDGCVL